MITLGLANTFPKRREPLHSGLQTISEMVELLEPSPVVLQALSETVAWSLRRPLQQDQFRSRELDPSAFLRVPPFGESNIGVWLERKRESYQSAINAINANRSALVRDRNIKVADSAVAKSKGRLLLYEPPGCADPTDFSKRFLETPGGVAEKWTSQESPPEDRSCRG
jgi:hypothetical protein